MRKKLLCVLFLLGLSFSLTACGKESVDNSELTAYKTSMEAVLSNFETIDYAIKTIDPDADDDSSINELLHQFDLLEAEFKSLSEIAVPADFSYNESLADDAYSYMVQANEYYHQAFANDSYDETYLVAADECYKRANKRVQYIINILHGELPQDESISYQ